MKLPSPNAGLNTAGLLAAGLTGDGLGEEPGDGDALKKGTLLDEGDAL